MADESRNTIFVSFSQQNEADKDHLVTHLNGVP